MNDRTTSQSFTPDTARADPTDVAAVMRDMLMAQALSLQAMFAELMEDAAKSRPYLDSTATYTRLALRAQGNCRAALDTVVRADRAAQRIESAAKK